MASHGKYICKQCPASFSRMERLERHVNSVHTGAKPYECDECDAKFRRKDHLTRHKFIHSGERKWECGTCSAAFYEQSHWKRHMQTHEKPYGSRQEVGPIAEARRGEERRGEERSGEGRGEEERRGEELGREEGRGEERAATQRGGEERRGVTTHHKRIRSDSLGSFACHIVGLDRDHPCSKRPRTDSIASVVSGRSQTVLSNSLIVKLPPSKMAAVVAQADPFETLPEIVQETFPLHRHSSSGLELPELGSEENLLEDSVVNSAPIRIVPLSPSAIAKIPGLADALKHKCFYPRCTKEFKQKRDLRSHVRYDHETDFLSCPTCSREFKRPKFWEKHMETCGSNRLRTAETPLVKLAERGSTVVVHPRDATLPLPGRIPLGRASSMSDFVTEALGLNPILVANELNAHRELRLSPVHSVASEPLSLSDDYDLSFVLSPASGDLDAGFSEK